MGYPHIPTKGNEGLTPSRGPKCQVVMHARDAAVFVIGAI